MGVSSLVGLATTVSLAVFVCLREYGKTWISIPFLYISVGYFLLTVASLPAVNFPFILGKSSNGTFPLWSKLLFSPFLVGVRMFRFVRRWWNKEPPYNEIYEGGLYVGGWPSSLDELPPGEPAIIDCTCEFPKSSALSQNVYMCIPTWDTRAPQLSQINKAVCWALSKRSQEKPVYVHCAYGHGRSSTIMCAVLVALGVAEDWKQAEKIIQERRPCVLMNALQRKTLEDWSKTHHPLGNGQSK